MNAPTERYAVVSLLERYGVDEAELFTRFNQLDIYPQSHDGGLSIHHEHLEILDALDDHIYDGGSLTSFMEQFPHLRGHQPDNAIQPSPPEEISPVPVDRQQAALAVLVEAIAARMTTAPDPLAHLRALEDACNNHWLLSTAELGQLLKMSPKTINKHPSFQRRGFVFQKVGRDGNETIWEIKKPRSQNSTWRPRNESRFDTIM